MARLQAICGLTSAELSASLADIDARPGTDTARMIDAAQRFIDSPIGMLTIYGSCGNAKTVALQAIVNEVAGLDLTEHQEAGYSL